MSLAASLNNNRIWNRHGLRIVWGLAVLALLLAISSIAYSEYLDQQHKTADYAPQKLAPIENKSAPQYRVTDITSANLFGDPRPKEVITKNIPKTTLNLKLIGVLWATDQAFARVIIQSGNKEANLYGIGADIEGANASVKEIHSNEILISRNGATEKLSLVTKKDGKDIISHDTSKSYEQVPVSYSQPDTSVDRVSANIKPISPNGKNRKIREPNFSGLDRALKKMNEL